MSCDPSDKPIDVDAADELDARIRFNNAWYDNLGSALTACRSLKSKNSANVGSNWYLTEVVINRNTSAFTLKCATCKATFSQNNPSNFWRTHKNTKCKHDREGFVLYKGVTRKSTDMDRIVRRSTHNNAKFEFLQMSWRLETNQGHQ
jgi:hypothetical protein